MTFIPKLSLAQQEQVGTNTVNKLTNPLKVTSIEGLIAAIIEIVVKIGAPLIVLFIIYSGFLFVKAQGNEEKLKEAKKALAWTVVGAAILLGAWLIAEVIQGTIKNLGG